jgi:hypothetical protein
MGWSCWGTENGTGNRTITINGKPLDCGGWPIPAPKTGGYTVIDIGPGTNDLGQIWWWDTYNSPCTIPAGGLDF